MKKRLISAFILIVYSVILVKILVLKDLPVIHLGPVQLNFGGTQEGPANLIPFKTILPYLLGYKGWMIAGINLLGNIVLLVPIGFLFPYVFQSMTGKKSLVLALAAGFAIEGLQAVLHVGIFDIDDVILNGFGVMVGYWAFVIFEKMNRPMQLKMAITTSLVAITAVAAFYFLTMSHTRREPDVFIQGVERVRPDSSNNGTATILQGKDPCNGTGGTGQIVQVGKDSIILERNDGIKELISLTDRTVLKNSAGFLSQSDLKIGDRVTVVVMSKHTATLVLVCNTQSSGAAK